MFKITKVLLLEIRVLHLRGEATSPVLTRPLPWPERTTLPVRCPPVLYSFVSLSFASSIVGGLGRFSFFGVNALKVPVC